MVSDQDIAEALESLLRQTNPSSTTFTSFNSVVHHLESKLGLDLTPKLDFIQNQIHLLLRSHPPPPPLHYHQPPPKTHFVLHQNPNFHQPPPFAADELGFRPPPPTKTESSATATTDAAPTETPKECSQTGKKRRGGPGGLNKLCGVSPELQAIVGHPALPRTEIVKQLWAYIRKNNLQDPSNKRKIICNDELRLVFETDCTDMFKMNKLLAKHIITLEPTKPVGRNSKKPKVEVESETKNAESEPDVIISEALANFFGTSGREMIQSEVLSHVWEYIKVNQLEEVGLNFSVAFGHKGMEFGVDKNEACTIASDEIKEVLQMVCRVHNLPLAHAWVPCRAGCLCTALVDGGNLGVSCHYNRHDYEFGIVNNGHHLKEAFLSNLGSLSTP